MKKFRLSGDVVNDEYAWIYEYFGDSYISPSLVGRYLEEAGGEEITFTINSGGGSVFSASEIYSMMKSYPNRIIAEIHGLSASAASVISMGADTVKISPTGMLMIHNVSTYCEGDFNEMEKTAGILKNLNKTIANAYILKTGLSEEEVLDLMDKETWLEAEQALEKGFADEILFNDDKILGFSNIDLKHAFSNKAGIPQNLIDRLNTIVESHNKKVDERHRAGLLDQAKERFSNLKNGGKV